MSSFTEEEVTTIGYYYYDADSSYYPFTKSQGYTLSASDPYWMYCLESEGNACSMWTTCSDGTLYAESGTDTVSSVCRETVASRGFDCITDYLLPSFGVDKDEGITRYDCYAADMDTVTRVMTLYFENPDELSTSSSARTLITPTLASATTTSGSPTPTAFTTSFTSPTASPVEIADEKPKEKESSKAGPIAGGVVGGIAIIAVAVIAVLFLLRRSRNKAYVGGVGKAGPEAAQIDSMPEYVPYPTPQQRNSGIMGSPRVG